MVRAIVDFPVPAMPFSQKMHLSSPPSAHALIWLRTSTRVSLRHRGSCCLSAELKAAWAAYGKSLSRCESSAGRLQPQNNDVRMGLSVEGTVSDRLKDNIPVNLLLSGYV